MTTVLVANLHVESAPSLQGKNVWQSNRRFAVSPCASRLFYNRIYLYQQNVRVGIITVLTYLILYLIPLRMYVSHELYTHTYTHTHIQHILFFTHTHTHTELVAFVSSPVHNITKIGMDEVLAHYACTFKNSDLH